MTAATTSPPVATAAPAQPRGGVGLLTAEEFLRLPEPPGAGKRELEYGRVVEMPPPDFGHAERQSELTTELVLYKRRTKLGRVITECGFILARNPDVVKLPDVAFVLETRISPDYDPDTYFDGPPDLAVEVLSKSETLTAALDKIDEYLGYGVRLCWLLNPRRRTLTVYRRGAAAVELGEAEQVDGGDVLPGFSCKVGDLLG